MEEKNIAARKGDFQSLIPIPRKKIHPHHHNKTHVLVKDEGMGRELAVGEHFLEAECSSYVPHIILTTALGGMGSIYPTLLMRNLPFRGVESYPQLRWDLN